MEEANETNMKQKHTKLLFGLLAIPLAIMLVITACRKQNSMATQTRPSRSAMARETSFSDWPSISDGMLTFRDGQHLQDYIDALDVLTSNTDSISHSDTLSSDDVLESVEAGLGFTSWRHNWVTSFEHQDADGWSTLEEIPKPMFSDIVLRSILNSDADVRVGDSIIHFVNSQYAISLAADQSQLLSDAHGLSASASLEDVCSIDPGGFNSVVFPYEWGIVNVDRLARTTQATSYPFSMQKPVASSPDFCAQRTLVQLDRIELVGLTVNGIALCVSTCQINWGDGHTSNLSGQRTYFNVQHNYSSTGNYTITINSRSTNPVGSTAPAWDNTISFPISVPTNSCAYAVSKASPWYRYYSNNGMNRAWDAQSSISNWTSTFSVMKSRISCETHSYLYTSNKWKTSRIDRVVAQFSATKYDANCNNSWGDNGADWANDSRSASTQHTNQGWVGWHRIWSNHRIYVGNYMGSFDIELYPCR